MEEKKENHFTYDQSIDLARRYHFMLLAACEREDKKDITTIQKTFRLYENMIDKILHGDLDEKSLTVLKDLPSWKSFDKEIGYKAYKKSLFKNDI